MVDRDQVVSLLQPRLEKEPDLVAAWLYGSVARGTAHANSDVDVAVLFHGPHAREHLLDLQAELCSVVGREVQVVDSTDAPVDLLHRVFRDGVLVVDRDRSARIRFEVDARNRYFDMRPILLEYRRPRNGAA
jgi:predicted nucleotidyltransferase